MSFIRKPLVAPLILPTAILVASVLTLPFFGEMQAESRLGLIQLPYYLLGLVMILGLFLNRTREAGVCLALLVLYFCVQTELQSPLEQVRSGSVYFLLCALMPLVLVVLAILPEQKTTDFWGIALVLAAPILFIIGLQVLDRALVTDAELNQIWPPRKDAPSLLAEQAFYWSGMAILVCLIGFIWRRDVSQVSVFFAAIYAFSTLNWLHLPMISTVMILAAGLTLLVGSISSLLAMLYRDELTGLMNRKALNKSMDELKEGDILVMADIDKFKNLNDTHGHDTGDEVLKLVAALLSEVGERGKAYRYGGEEFTFLFRGRNVDRALDALQEVRKKVAEYPIAIRNRSKRPKSSKSGASYRKNAPAKKVIKTSISMGAVLLREDENPMDALKRADTQLYKAKEAGRNCICKDFRR